MSKYYCAANEGFYDSKIHEIIPEGSVPITNEQYSNLLKGKSSGKKIEISAEGNPELIDHSYSFVDSFNNKLSKVITAYKQAMATIKANYTDEDIASFPTQEAEAKAWDADNSAETPLLDYMLANRPTVDKATLVSRILQNSVIYKQIAGPAIGKKQHYEDLLYALKAQHDDPEQPDVTQADIDAIVVDFSTS